MTILFTGYSGFVGRHVHDILTQDGHDLVCLGRKPLRAGARGTHIDGDLGSKVEWSRIPWKNIDAVLHLASAGVKSSRRDWEECFRVNILGTAQLLDQMKQAQNLQRVVLTPTFYENLAQTLPCLKSNPYIGTKSVATEMWRAWANSVAIDLSLATIFQVYGADDDTSSVIAFIFNNLRQNRKATIGSGEARRDWIHVSDVALGLGQIFRNPRKQGINSYDIGTGELTSLKTISKIIADSLGVPHELVEFDEARNRPETYAELAAKINLNGWRPGTSLLGGIKNLINT